LLVDKGKDCRVISVRVNNGKSIQRLFTDDLIVIFAGVFYREYVAIGRMPEVQCEWRYLTDLLVWSDAKSLGVVVGLRLSSEETTAEVSDGGQRGFAMELFK